MLFDREMENMMSKASFIFCVVDQGLIHLLLSPVLFHSEIATTLRERTGPAWQGN